MSAQRVSRCIVQSLLIFKVKCVGGSVDQNELPIHAGEMQS